MKTSFQTIEWLGNSFKIIDQRLLPHILDYIIITDYNQATKAIQDMQIRGAPAIGIAGAFSLVLAAQELSCKGPKEFFAYLKDRAHSIKAARPTAVNLSWAIDKLMHLAETYQHGDNLERLLSHLEREAIAMHRADLEANIQMGEYGKSIVPLGANILTHCNAGALATVGYGTALGVIRSAFKQDPTIHVYVDETRPRLQGAKLTTWELLQEHINFTLITDNMAGFLMYNQKVDLVVVGADRIASNGDTANKIGTYSLAVLAKENNIPFYIAAPLSTIDLHIQSGKEILIEERCQDEVLLVENNTIAPEGVTVLNPAFDMTPAKYITGIITEKGILKPDFSQSIARIFQSTHVAN